MALVRPLPRYYQAPRTRTVQLVDFDFPPLEPPTPGQYPGDNTETASRNPSLAMSHEGDVRKVSP